MGKHIVDDIDLGGRINHFRGDDIASAATIDLNAATGNLVYITGNTDITDIADADQAGVDRICVFADRLKITHDAAKIKLPYGEDLVVEAGDVVVFQAETAEIWKVTLVSRAPLKAKAEVDLADTDASTLTAAQLLDSGIFKATPTTARSHTTDTAANIVAALPGAKAGAWFDFAFICTAAFAETIQAGAGVTLVGDMVLNDNSGSFRALITDAGSGTEAVTIYRV
jgi:uncharacterized cupin superfamily protein